MDIVNSIAIIMLGIGILVLGNKVDNIEKYINTQSQNLKCSVAQTERK